MIDNKKQKLFSMTLIIRNKTSFFLYNKISLNKRTIITRHQLIIDIELEEYTISVEEQFSRI